MGIENLKVGHVAKQKNPRKKMQEQINEIGGATSYIIGELRGIGNHLMGLETLTMNLAEFLGKGKEFEEHMKDKINKLEREKAIEEEKGKKVKKLK